MVPTAASTSVLLDTLMELGITSLHPSTMPDNAMLLSSRTHRSEMIPELFMCPISLDLMSDPVTLPATGQTYDRPNIQRWLAAGHRTCPVTMQPLHQGARRDMVPNRTLKHLIDRWLLTGRNLSVSELALPALRDNLQLCTSTATTVETLRIVRSLSPAGFCPSLLRLLLSRGRDDDEDAAAVAELAVDCLLGSPSTHELAAALDGALLDQSSSASSFALLLRHGSAKVKVGLCRVMEIVAAAATAAGEQQSSTVVGQTEPVMGALAGLVKDKGCTATSHAALRAMAGICSSDKTCRETAVAAGAVDALISYFSSCSGSRKAAERVCLALALETLELVLVSEEAGRQAMYRHPDATATLVKMVFRVPSDQGGSEHAIGSLLVACSESATVRVDAINAGLLTQLLLLLQSECSPKAKTNARALLKLLRAMWALD